MVQIALAVIVVVLAVLAVSSQFVLVLPDIFSIALPCALAFVCAAWFLLRDKGNFKATRWLNLVLKFALILALLLIFTLRTLMVQGEFAKQVPSQRMIISATASIHEISDGIYDPLTNSSYRQVAVLSDIRPSDAPKQTKRAIDVQNPFAVPSDNLNNSNADTTQVANPLADLEGMTVLLRATPAKSEFTADDFAKLTPATQVPVVLMITPPKRTQGFDVEQWLQTRHIHAQAQILQIGTAEPMTQNLPLSTQLWHRLQQLRGELRAHFYRDWQALSGDEQQARAVTLSLLTGDRALIDKPTKDLYMLAGISHLLAISGTHVLFLAMILSAVVLKIIDAIKPMLYQRIQKQHISMAVMLSASVLYALFTGFDVPAMRTVYLLAMMFAVQLLLLPIGRISALMAVMLLMIFSDPFVLWQAGFWLSCVAVLLLMRYQSSDELGMMTHSAGVLNIIELLRLQGWLFITMLPMTVWLFGKVSLWGLVVNLFAIGFFGVLIVPLNLLAGVFYLVLPSMADMLWGVSSWLILQLHLLLDFSLSMSTGGWLYAPFGFAGFLLLFLATALWVMPRILPRSVAILPLVLLIFVMMKPKPQSLQFTTLPSAPNISQTLISFYGQNTPQHWLVLADIGGKKLSEAQTDLLIAALHRQGVRRLNGVIVQTPSGAFVPLVVQLREQMGVDLYWQAGKLNTDDKVIAQPCQADQHYQKDGLSIRALTGWQQIDDERVWACALEFSSDAAVMMNAQSSADDADLPNVSKPNRLIIAQSDSALLWQLWAMLCKTQTVDFSDAIWLTHSRAQSPEMLESTPPAQLHFVDQINQ